MWDFGIIDLIDVLGVAALMFYLYRWSQGNGTIVIFKGLIAIIVLWVGLRFFQFRLLGGILDLIVSVSMIILVILFQNEIRQALIRLGSRHQWSSMLRFFGKEELAKNDDTKWVDAVILACQHMSEHKVGALIVVQRYDDVEPLISPQVARWMPSFRHGSSSRCSSRIRRSTTGPCSFEMVELPRLQACCPPAATDAFRLNSVCVTAVPSASPKSAMHRWLW